MSTLDTHELAWAAGFFDGEGHVGYQPRVRIDKSRGHFTKAKIGQIDPQVLARFAAAVGVGKVHGPYQWAQNAASTRPPKPVWEYSSSNRNDIQHMACQLWQWLSPVKRQQFHDALQASLPKPKEA